MVEYIVSIVIIVCFSGFLIMECLGLIHKPKTKKENRLFYAHITEEGYSPEEVFEFLDKSGIEPNYLGTYKE